MQDEEITCEDCGNKFTFTVKEQEFYNEKGFENKPKRCKDCRIKKKQERNSGRKSYDVVCADCGADTTVPFEPRGDKPVYCLDCYKKRQDQ